jgi:hypothetical protein
MKNIFTGQSFYFEISTCVDILKMFPFERFYIF